MPKTSDKKEKRDDSSEDVDLSIATDMDVDADTKSESKSNKKEQSKQKSRSESDEKKSDKSKSDEEESPQVLKKENKKTAQTNKILSDSDEKEDSKSSNFKKEEKQKESDRKKYNNGIIGLQNLGNTCYLNSVLQCMFALHNFKKFILEKGIYELEKVIKNHMLSVTERKKIKWTEEQINKLRNRTLTYQTFALFEKIFSDEVNSKDAISPTNFRIIFSERNKMFSGNNQQDSHEAFLAILDNLHNELGLKKNVKITNKTKEFIDYEHHREKCMETIKDKDKSKRKKESALLKFNEYRTENLETHLKYEAATYWMNYIKSGGHSVINELFDGLNQISLMCPKCDNINYVFDVFRILSLEIPNEKILSERRSLGVDDNSITIYDCFRSYCRPEFLDSDNKWKCNACDNHVKAKKQIRIWEPPSCLIIQLKRFQRTPRGIIKKSTLVDYPITDLNLTEFISQAVDTELKYIYDLQAVICHSGTNNGGHYISYSRAPLDKNNWYRHNDAHTDGPLKAQNVKSGDAYILVYCLKNKF